METMKLGRISKDTVQLEQSFAEKYRTMTVVACNARSVGLDGVKGRVLRCS